MVKNVKKIYESKKLYSKKYNLSNINVQLDREMINALRIKLNGEPIKEYIENLIKTNL